jgi:hypothetical protein
MTDEPAHSITRASRITHAGKTARVEEHAAARGLALTVVLERLRKGWSIDRTFGYGRSLPPSLAKALRVSAGAPRMSRKRKAEIISSAIANSLARERAKDSGK